LSCIKGRAAKNVRGKWIALFMAFQQPKKIKIKIENNQFNQVVKNEAFASFPSGK